MASRRFVFPCAFSPKITLQSGAKLIELIKRPQLSYKDLAPFDPERPVLPTAVTEQVEVQIKYEGYIKRQLAEVKRREKLDDMTIPEDIDYDAIGGIRIEARQKLKSHRPMNLGAASRISGVSPADISVLLIYLAK